MERSAVRLCMVSCMHHHQGSGPSLAWHNQQAACEVTSVDLTLEPLHGQVDVCMYALTKQSIRRRTDQTIEAEAVNCFCCFSAVKA